MSSYNTDILVRFAHVDGAGVVFYPRYFAMLNQVVEDWFGDELGYSFAEMTRDDNNGLPLVEVTCKFSAPSFIGDMLNFSLTVNEVRANKIMITISASCNGEQRLSANMVLVPVTLQEKGLKTRHMNDAMIQRIEQYHA